MPSRKLYMAGQRYFGTYEDPELRRWCVFLEGCAQSRHYAVPGKGIPVYEVIVEWDGNAIAAMLNRDAKVTKTGTVQYFKSEES